MVHICTADIICAYIGEYCLAPCMLGWDFFTLFPRILLFGHCSSCIMVLVYNNSFYALFLSLSLTQLTLFLFLCLSSYLYIIIKYNYFNSYSCCRVRSQIFSRASRSSLCLAAVSALYTRYFFLGGVFILLNRMPTIFHSFSLCTRNFLRGPIALIEYAIGM